MGKTFALALASAIILVWSAQAGSQQMRNGLYRCGSKYQDRPCQPTAADRPADKAEDRAVEKPAVSASDARAEHRKNIRCQNFGRQVEELSKKQKENPRYAESFGVQIKSLEKRMAADSC